MPRRFSLLHPLTKFFCCGHNNRYTDASSTHITGSFLCSDPACASCQIAVSSHPVSSAACSALGQGAAGSWRLYPGADFPLLSHANRHLGFLIGIGSGMGAVLVLAAIYAYIRFRSPEAHVAARQHASDYLALAVGHIGSRRRSLHRYLKDWLLDWIDYRQHLQFTDMVREWYCALLLLAGIAMFVHFGLWMSNSPFDVFTKTAFEKVGVPDRPASKPP